MGETKPAVREGFLEEVAIEMRTRKIPLGMWAGVHGGMADQRQGGTRL